jgi:hypothetical protein
MVIFSKIIKYILLLTIFQTFLSLKLDTNLEQNEIEINLEIKAKNAETTDFEENNFLSDEEIKNITISNQKYQKVNIKCNNDTNINLLLFIYNGNMDSMDYTGYSDTLKDISDLGNLTQFEINTKNIINNKLDIKINIALSSTSSTETIVQIFKVINNEYRNITEKNKEKININSKNFIKFLDKKETRIKVEINFKTEIDDEIAYGIISLPTNKTQFLPTSFSFNKTYEEIKKESHSKIKEIEIQEEVKKMNDYYGMQHFAFIFSIKNNKEYEIRINYDIMDIFLICSIILALIFAVITFFLIRIKQPTQKTNDFYEEKKEEDEADN